MAIKFYNTATKRLEDFVAVTPGRVSMYTCGPTVYNYVHLGNLRTFLFEDFLKQWLKYCGYSVTHVKNLTDIDDKTISASQKQGISLKELTDFYADAFFKDIEALRINHAVDYPRATNFIPEMLEIIENLMTMGLAYRVDSGVYFRSHLGRKYTQLLNLDDVVLQSGASGRVETETDKEHPEDFVLWKAWTPEDGPVFWDSNVGKGRVGWHLECSAMSLAYFPDQTIDIHTGGIDLVFPHHHCETLQSEAETGRKFVNYWLHAAHLLVDGQKMAKSLNNFYTLRDVTAKGYHPMAIRYLLLSAHYRQPLNFTWESLDSATISVKKWHDLYHRLQNFSDAAKPVDLSRLLIFTNKWKASLENDLNVSEALADLYNFMHYLNDLPPHLLRGEEANAALAFLDGINQIYQFLVPEELFLPQEIITLLTDRRTARQSKDWSQSDALRQQALEKGWIIEDTPQGQRYKKVNL